MITQAMILAAGKGTRMQPLTLTTPKPLICVANKPLIVWHIERLVKAGIRDITINVGYLGDVLASALSAMSFDCRLHISKEPSEPLETAGGIKLALDRGLLRDEPFILVNGDVWTTFDFRALTQHDCTTLAHLMLIDNPSHNLLGDFVLHENGVVEAKMSTDSHAALTFAGISVMSPRLFDGLSVGEAAPLAPLLINAMQQKQVTGQKLGDVWVDVGTVERLQALEQYLLDKNNYINQ